MAGKWEKNVEGDRQRRSGEETTGGSVRASRVARVPRVCGPPSITRSNSTHPITTPPLPAPRILSLIHSTHHPYTIHLDRSFKLPSQTLARQDTCQAATSWKISFSSIKKSSCPTRCAKSCLNARRAPGLCCLSSASMYTGFMVEALSIILPRGQ